MTDVTPVSDAPGPRGRAGNAGVGTQGRGRSTGPDTSGGLPHLNLCDCAETQQGGRRYGAPGMLAAQQNARTWFAATIRQSAFPGDVDADPTLKRRRLFGARRSSLDRNLEHNRLVVDRDDLASELFDDPVQPHDVLIANNLAGDLKFFRTCLFGLRAKAIE